MARYTDSSCKRCRRAQEKLFLKGDRCYSVKCPLSPNNKRNTTPGQHGKPAGAKQSDYGLQLREKQKVKQAYGVMEKQFRKYYVLSLKKQGVTGETLLQYLERRFDNVVYRLGFASSRKEARQLVTHNHFTVNGKKVNIPSYLLKAGDEIEVKSKSRKSPKFIGLIEAAGGKNVPDYLSVDYEKMSGKLLSLPTRSNIDLPVEERLIVELYSK
ncbi:MAG: 30S ribosomal protein S4 [Eubacteriaceae bacterium]|nr:30S ribosomal protein S4 [Eubacteriaceae bacterium]